MKATTTISHNRKIIVIEFDRDIPLFPETTGWTFPNRRQNNHLFDRGRPLDTYACSMAFENQGAIPLEFSRRPYDIYFEFLQDLVCLPGFVAIAAADRYSITIAIGKLFDFRQIVHQVSLLVQQHFYPDEAIDMEMTEAVNLAAKTRP